MKLTKDQIKRAKKKGNRFQMILEEIKKEIKKDLEKRLRQKKEERLK